MTIFNKCLAAAAIAFVLLLGFVLVQEARLGPRPFDSRIWRANPSRRLAMVDDLCQNRRLIGLSGQQLIDLLGSPDEMQVSGFPKVAAQFTYRCLDDDKHLAVSVSLHLSGGPDWKHATVTDGNKREYGMGGGWGDESLPTKLKVNT